MILLVLILIIFAALVVFLLSFAQTVSQEKYLDLYVNNLMLSIMKTDTGYSDSNCKLMSDATACAFILPDWRCGGSGMTCLELTNKSLSEYMDTFDLISKNYRYLFIVSTYGFIARSGTADEGMELQFGDPELKTFAGKKRVANYVIQKTLAGNQYNLQVKLYVARKS
jgi:hypothetical protein